MSEHTIEKYAGNILNVQAVAKKDKHVVVLHPLLQMSRSAALVHAAWLVAIADTSENFEEFRSILEGGTRSMTSTPIFSSGAMRAARQICDTVPGWIPRMQSEFMADLISQETGDLVFMRMLVRRATLLDRFRALSRPGHWLNVCRRELSCIGPISALRLVEAEKVLES